MNSVVFTSLKDFLLVVPVTAVVVVLAAGAAEEVEGVAFVSSLDFKDS
jgi:hypothetical protein